jgi:ABC-2 type transport system ATP-binding protein
MSYGETEAVRGIDLEVARGEIFAFLGPNGAGKTTTVEILEGYRKRTGGDVRVLGEDPATAGRAWRDRIGIVLQSNSLDPYLTVRESIELSGGQQRRLDVGMALVGDPELLFLDEPTTGFDPSARRQFWEVIESLQKLGKTIFLTTHYMDEAQRLADRVTIIAAGRIVAQGTPEDLGEREKAAATIRYRDAAGEEVTIETVDPVRELNRLTTEALKRGEDLEALEVTRPSLEDVYLDLTETAEGASAE